MTSKTTTEQALEALNRIKQTAQWQIDDTCSDGKWDAETDALNDDVKAIEAALSHAGQGGEVVTVEEFVGIWEGISNSSRYNLSKKEVVALEFKERFPNGLRITRAAGEGK